jgi:hypothetical protein
VDADRIDQAGLAAIAALLEPRAAEFGVAGLRERKDLEPTCVEGLRPAFGERLEKSRRVAIPQWESVGQVDLVVHSPETSGEFSLLAELKWCGAGRNVLYEGIWDLFKMALGTRRPEQPRGYLITGAHSTVWEESAFSDLFETKDHDLVELCMRDLGGRDHWLAWDALLYGGGDRHPDAVPAGLRTTVVGRARVGDGELRAVEVTVSEDDWIPFTDGWPYGERPERARQPGQIQFELELPASMEIAPGMCFTVGDDGTIQWDPATLPENQALVAELKRIGVWYGPDE